MKEIEIVQNLNYMLQDIYGDKYMGDLHFELQTSGDCSIINFCGYPLWNSEDDEREWLENKNDYESLEDYLLRALKNYRDNISNIISEMEK